MGPVPVCWGILPAHPPGPFVPGSQLLHRFSQQGSETWLLSEQRTPLSEKQAGAFCGGLSQAMRTRLAACKALVAHPLAHPWSPYPQHWGSVVVTGASRGATVGFVPRRNGDKTALEAFPSRKPPLGCPPGPDVVHQKRPAESVHQKRSHEHCGSLQPGGVPRWAGRPGRQLPRGEKLVAEGQGSAQPQPPEAGDLHAVLGALARRRRPCRQEGEERFDGKTQGSFSVAENPPILCQSRTLVKC